MRRPHAVGARPSRRSLLALGVLLAGLAPPPVAAEPRGASWRFVSLPDFLNADRLFPDPDVEPVIDFTLRAIAAEEPDFVLVPGDLVNGHWGAGEMSERAATYYGAWVERMRHHGLPFYAAIGDHEVGDNPWRREKVDRVPEFKRLFAEHLAMPRNGPPGMEGTAWWLRHRGGLIVALDVFELLEPGRSENPNTGWIVPKVSGAQLDWLRATLEANPDVFPKIVVAHTPFFGPVVKRNTSGLMLRGRQRSQAFQLMQEQGVHLALAGEAHAITCSMRGGIDQVVNGSLIGNGVLNYLVVDVDRPRLRLTLKEVELELDPPGRRWRTARIAAAARARGFRTVGSLVVDRALDPSVARVASGICARD